MMAPQAKARGAWLYGITAAVALIGLGDAIYLTVEHVTGQSVRCTLISGCSEVLSSSYAVVAGLPLAAIGAVAYFGAFSLATLAAFGSRIAGTLLAVLVGMMFLATLWLLYLQAFVIGHFCQFCLLSALVTVVLTGLVVAQRWKKTVGKPAPISE
jgi:uncharacterized membrane protein